jgi:hypothetical protein
MKQNSKPWTARRIHLWISVILAIPMTLIALSGVLISMRSVTGVTVPASWLGAEAVPQQLPINAFAQSGDGSQWVGNAHGLHRVAEGKRTPIGDFNGQEVIAVAFRSGADRPVVATRMAIWEDTGGKWSPVRRGRVRQLSTLPDGRVFTVIGGRGELADGKPFASDKPGEWQPFAPAIEANALLPKLDNPRVALHQFMRELHSGAYFFGKGPGEMVWSNILGWVLTTLTLTGLWMWLKAERVKARKRVAKIKPEHVPAGSPIGASMQKG